MRLFADFVKMCLPNNNNSLLYKVKQWKHHDSKERYFNNVGYN